MATVKEVSNYVWASKCPGCGHWQVPDHFCPACGHKWDKSVPRLGETVHELGITRQDERKCDLCGKRWILTYFTPEGTVGDHQLTIANTRKMVCPECGRSLLDELVVAADGLVSTTLQRKY